MSSQAERTFIMPNPVPLKRVIDFDRIKTTCDPVISVLCSYDVIRLIWDAEHRVIMPVTWSGEILTELDFDNLVVELSKFYAKTPTSVIDDHNLSHPLHCQSTEPKSVNKPERKKKSGYVYLIYTGAGYYKIGCSIDPQRRLTELSRQPPFDYTIICSIPTKDMYSLEEDLHNVFKHKRVNGEWFTLSGKDLDRVQKIAEDLSNVPSQ